MNRSRQHLDLFHKNILPLESDGTVVLWFSILPKHLLHLQYATIYYYMLLLYYYSSFKMRRRKNTLSNNSDNYNSEYIVHIFNVNYFQSK